MNLAQTSSDVNQNRYLVHIPDMNVYVGKDGQPVHDRFNHLAWMDKKTANSHAAFSGGFPIEMIPAPPAPAPAAVHAAPTRPLSPALAHLKQFRQFIIWNAVPDAQRPEKPRKVPSDYRTGQPTNAHDPAVWADYETAERAAAHFGAGYGVGFVLTRASRIAVLDYDGARQSDGSWHPIVGEIYARIPGAAVEVSFSGDGAHNWCSYHGELPANDITTVEIGGLKVELFLANKFIALGNQNTAQGDASIDCTAALNQLIAEHFPKKDDKEKSGWTDGPEKEWDGPTEDAKLIEIFLRNAKQTPTNRQLWEGDQVALSAYKAEPGRKDGVTFDPTAVDLLFAGRMMFYTGNDCERTLRLMESSPYSKLRLDKWETNVLRRETIGKAFSENVYRKNHRAEEAFSKPSSPMIQSLTVPDGTPNELTPEDFWAHLPSHKYINRYTRETYSADAINGHLGRFKLQLGMKPSLYLDMFRAVHQMSWHPGYPEILEAMRSDNGVLKPEITGRIFNRYREPDAVGSDADASLWVDHIRKIYPTDADYIIQWFAYRVQNPGLKINHALVLGSIQGTGKDWILKPLRYALGPANVATVKPTELFSQFNDWVESTLLIINEARDLGEESRFTFYETTKPLIAGPPDTLRCNLKGLTPYSVPNVMAVVITTNNKLSGLYLPPDDRRHYVTWSPAERPSREYFDHLWDWMDNQGGQEAVVGYLKRLDVSGFGAQADPPKTEAWHQVVAASINPDELSLSDAIEGIQIATIKEIIATLHLKGYGELADSLRKSPRKVPHILETAGFEVLPNPYAKGDGRWRLIDGRKDTLYVDRRLPISQRLELANKKARGGK